MIFLHFSFVLPLCTSAHDSLGTSFHFSVHGPPNPPIAKDIFESLSLSEVLFK